MNLATLPVLASMAVRNLAAHRVKSLVVGSLMIFGTFLVVSGTALLDSVRASMQESITSSLAGHLQVYSADAEDDLALFGGGGMGTMDYGEVDAFAPVEAALADVPHVAAVVPMGITQATIFGTSELDRVIESLRVAVDAGDASGVEQSAGHLRSIATSLEGGVDALAQFTSDTDQVAEDRAALARVQDPAFWQEFRADPAAGLLWLDTNIAPLGIEGALYYMRLIGTDLDQFTTSFHKFRLVQGEPVPEGRRGLLLSEFYFENVVKNRVARELDAIKTELDDGATLAGDATLANRVQANAGQYQRIIFQLTPRSSQELRDELADYLGDTDADAPLDGLLEAFLAADDATFDERYDWFYEHIAPRIRLYEMGVGDTITLRGFTQSGYLRSVNVKIYGTFKFEGLEDSNLAGANQLCDLVTFRSLYGKMTASDLAELQDIKSSVGAAEVSREDAEAALFGGPPADPTPAPAVDPAPDAAAGNGSLFDAFGEGGDIQLDAAIAAEDRVYTPAEMKDGLALSAAIVLDDPEMVRQTLDLAQGALDAAGLDLQVIDWQQASGIVGQLILVLQVVLYVAIFIVFLVTLVIINNTMVMTTMDRTVEIGTMRAIGAQRTYVVTLLIIETLVLGLIAGTIGAALGTGFIGWLGQVGIPAVQDILVLLFAGPRLYPQVSAGNMLFGVGAVSLISVLSTLYPALLGAAVQPVVAMRGKE